MLVFLFSSCDNTTLDIENGYGFTLTMQKYREEIKNGETKEFEFFINRESIYTETHYEVSVFLRAGTGTIAFPNGNVLEENTFYAVSDSGFILSYTSLSTETHTIEVLVRDSFGNEKETSIQLVNKTN